MSKFAPPTTQPIDAPGLRPDRQVGPETNKPDWQLIGPAVLHFHDASDGFVARSVIDGEHSVVVTKLNQKTDTTSNETVGVGRTAESAVQNTLEEMRSLETIRTKSLAFVRMTENSQVDFTALEHYRPRIAPGSETYPVPTHLQELLTDYGKGMNTYENTVKQPGWQQEIRTMVEGYLAANPAGQKLIQDLKIRSLSHLTPEQAVKLSAAFVQNVSKYSYETVGQLKTTADQSTAQELLRQGILNKNDPAWSGNGVCRNVASNVKAVFESLKTTQAEGVSMLNNTYAVFKGGVQGAGYADERDDGSTFNLDASGHAWNAFVTIDAQGSAVTTIIDATWALDRSADAALEHLDRTNTRAATEVSQLFEKSELKEKAFDDVTYYMDKLARGDHTRGKTAKFRDAVSEYAVTSYLAAANQLTEIPDGHTMPREILRVAFRMRDKLDRNEISTLFALDKAGGSFESDKIKDIIAGYDSGRGQPVPEWKKAENLIFNNDDLQVLAYEAVGTERVAYLADMNGGFRARLRQLQPNSLPPFDARANPSDAQELGHLASRSGIHDKAPDAILQAIHKKIERLSGDPAIAEAITAGRSDYDLAANLPAIMNSLRKRQK